MTEYRLQALWNFTADSNFHSYWFKMPHCTCPYMDNQERIGTGMFIISGDCPLHGNRL